MLTQVLSTMATSLGAGVALAVALTVAPAQSAQADDTAAPRVGAPTTVPATTSAIAAPMVSAALARSSNVFVVGDSLTTGSGPYTQSRLRGQVKRVAVNGRVGRTTSEGIGLLGSSTAKRSRVWVVELGTNDAASGSATKHNVGRVMRMAGANRRVIWVNVVRPGGYDRVNSALSSESARYSNLSIVNWAGFIATHRSYLRGDGVHCTTSGYRARGYLIADAARLAAAYA